MSRITIEGSQYPLEKVFSDDFQFNVPFYQRPYAWTNEHAGVLLDDLLSAMAADNVPIEELNPYFLGSIVLIKEKSSPQADILDGQQRLTTLTVVLAALRHLVGKEMAEHVTPFLYEKGNPLKGTANRYRVTLRNRDAQFFQDYIQDEAGIPKVTKLDPANLSDSQRNLRDNVLLFVNRLQQLSQEQRLRLAKFIIQSCFMVVVTTPDFDAAYRIFTILNDRGLPLSHTDILKAEIIGQIPDNDAELYSKKWEDVEDNLGRDGFADLFAHVRMIYRKAKLRQTLLSEFRQYVRPTENPRAFIDEVLIPYGEAFWTVTSASYESITHADQVNASLKWLGRIDNFDWIPPAILYLARNQNDPQLLTRVFADLERLAAGLMVKRANINERIERYGKVLRIAEGGEDIFAPDSPLQLTQIEIREILAALEGPLYFSKKVAPYVLLRLDSALSQAVASYNFPSITVEHVLPQTPKAGSVWTRWFPDALERFNYVHKLGNLALLSGRKNSQAQNCDFEEKKKKYFTTRKGVSPFALTSQVLGEQVWTPEVIERRQRELIGVLRRVWRL